ncbi:Hpt domain-containing protein [Nocardioides sp.]|uniref:Hpt domain-containing protein n=1 Tax=Nocardioides sp. TaxID=35761 RepID=UPI0035113DF2
MTQQPPDPYADLTGPATPPIEGLDTARLDVLRDLDPGDTTYLDRAIDNFEANSSAAMAALHEHVAADDAAAFRAVVHKIAGSALNLGAQDAGALARETEVVVERDGLAAAAALLPRLEPEMARARELLRRYQATYRA